MAEKILVAIPCMDTVHSLFCKSLVGMAAPPGTDYGFGISSLIYDARNQLTLDALNAGYEKMLWLDSDMMFTSNLLTKLLEVMSVTEADLVSGLYFSRKAPIKPVVYSRLEIEVDGDNAKFHVDPYYDYPKGVFDIKACGFGAALMTTKLAADMIEKYGTCFSPIPGIGEDLSFCYRANEMNAKLVCDSRIKLEHVGITSFGEEDYLAFREYQKQQEEQKDG